MTDINNHEDGDTPADEPLIDAYHEQEGRDLCAEAEAHPERFRKVSISEKLSSPMRTFLFIRSDGFYPINLPEATVRDNAECNSGTIRVEDAETGEVVWSANQEEVRP